MSIISVSGGIRDTKLIRGKMKRKLSISLLIGIIGIILVASGIIIVSYYLWEIRSAKKDDSALREEYTKAREIDNTDSEKAPKIQWYDDIDIDFKGLKETNPDVVGWITMDGVDELSYPVLQGKNNDTYLRTNIYGHHSISGSIFLETSNSPDFMDYHNIVYGHNMRNNAMFGSLKKFSDKGYYNTHQYFTIYTPERSFRYKIFAYQSVQPDSFIFTTGLQPGKDYQEFIDKIIKNSDITSPIDMKSEYRIVTLSTCTSDHVHRFVVHGVCIDTYKNT